MKKFVKYGICAVALLMWAAGYAHGQTATDPPLKVEIPPVSTTVTNQLKDYYQHGLDKTSVDAADKKSYEAVDSVTITSFMKYFVLPDPSVNTAYNYTTVTPTNFTGVVSEFDWTLSNSNGTFKGAGPAAPLNADNKKPLIIVNWTTLGASKLTVQEQPDGPTCPGDPREIDVFVIPKPKIEFRRMKEGDPDDDGECVNEQCVARDYDIETLGVEVSFAMKVFTKSNQVKVKYQIREGTDPWAAAPVITEDVTLGAETSPGSGEYNAGDLKITFYDYGEYEIKLTEVTDRISRKSMDADGNEIVGDIVQTPPANGADPCETFKYIVRRPVETGPIYRIPNNY